MLEEFQKVVALASLFWLFNAGGDIRLCTHCHNRDNDQ
jgi:hypothetical protein